MTLLGSCAPAGKETSMATYDPLAPHYDAYRNAPGYQQWLAGLIGLAAEHGLTGGLALDVGCGTGDSLEALIAAGYEASGVDPSPGMLDRARERFGDAVELGVSTLPEPLPTGPKVDLVTAFNDVLNYVEPGALSVAFASLAGRMRSGGLLLFDANTPLLYTTFCSATSVRETDDAFFVWQPLSEPTATTLVADLHAFARDPDDPERWERSVSHHVQHLHAPDTMTAALQEAGLELVDVRGAFDDGPLGGTPDDTQHIKRVYLARLP
jgi:SAM-dependent methyltransferase